ncbi:transcriptional regulator, MarR family [Rhizobiales bacterium GAS191]|jgi:DNA-binding MarR family transcriptional regulator|nr:transcriptional regulator, MarR family [Rhizobiales bacterium GAS113]SED93684.1 transcriptional regulator, MarR family [Rhizobiales bacterium GAS188]SEE57906.1 transcriptional regulator, MarR family [Rhizobiales bacterium GAS191]
MSMDDVYSKPGYLFRRAQQIAVAIFMEECAALDLTPVQYAALVAIREHAGLDATRLSALVAFDRSTLGDVLERLEQKNFILRQPSPEDKRVKLLHPTPRGRKVLTDVMPAMERAQARMLAPLKPSDRQLLLRLLGELVEGNNEVSRAPLRAGSARRG